MLVGRWYAESLRAGLVRSERWSPRRRRLALTKNLAWPGVRLILTHIAGNQRCSRTLHNCSNRCLRSLSESGGTSRTACTQFHSVHQAAASSGEAPFSCAWGLQCLNMLYSARTLRCRAAPGCRGWECGSCPPWVCETCFHGTCRIAQPSGIPVNTPRKHHYSNYSYSCYWHERCGAAAPAGAAAVPGACPVTQNVAKCSQDTPPRLQRNNSQTLTN
jgi:hypothetical protein